MAKGDPWQDVFSAQLENNLGTRSAAATNETPGPCRSPTFYCFSFFEILLFFLFVSFPRSPSLLFNFAGRHTNS